ncbi:hypothetical protein HYH02_014429 [Chlamydomonas schloesseri]|uniref:Glucose-6-phosphate 1-epimerase n=1 Tax=Chlamydomonas schloesseri TaxID=2026947 RepID=A0A835VT29_9CHLO|nr:hypothetical protein HYH02_014429 [Chlamydomonas schloesseri]|eukprot:KAG2428247.1 hypothetical protein HYH02_014429 [Chlamydomonas schloesseri]
MATSRVQASLEASSSGRGISFVNPSVRQPRLQANGGQAAFAPVARIVSAGQRVFSSSLQPPVATPHAGQPRSTQLQAVKERTKSLKTLSVADVDLAKLNEDWGIPGAVEFGEGQGGLPTVLLTHPQTGQQLVVYLYGATIAQWLKSDGTATFFDGPDNLYQEGVPLRTGVSVHFPQHRDGLLPQHGFADSMVWEVMGAGIDSPEVADQMAGYLEHLQDSGVVSRELLDAAAAGGEGSEAAAQLQEALSKELDGVDLTPHMLGDAAPFVMLRLRDTPATRKMWPHRFELCYKITLQTQEEATDADMRDVRSSLGMAPGGRTPEEEQAMERAAREALVAKRMAELEAGGVADAASGRGRRADDEEEEEQEEVEVVEAVRQAEEPQASTEPAPKRRGRPRKTADPEAAAATAGAAGGSAEEDDDEDGGGAGSSSSFLPPMLTQGEPGAVGPEPFVPPVQIKQQFWLRNRDKRGSEALRFQLGSNARFVTAQQPDCSDWIKVLGLGGSQVIDYTADPRNPELDLFEQDYLHYRGQPEDKTFVGAADATLYLCPGNRTHFEFIQRGGFKDMFVEQPAFDDEWLESGRLACIGTGYLASMKKLAPGKVWYAESVIRFHNRYWTQPIFGDDSMPPLPPIPTELLEGAGDEDDEFADIPAGGPGGEEGEN